MTQSKAKDTQIGGDHYKSMKIEPITFFAQNQTPFPEANTCKYILRHRHKNGIEDLKKARHMIDLMIEEYYPEEVTPTTLETLSTMEPLKFGGDPIDHGEKEFMDATVEGFNINSYVWLKLTPHGRKIMEDATGVNETEQFKLQLWELMQVFGNSFYNGAPQVIEDNLVYFTEPKT